MAKFKVKDGVAIIPEGTTKIEREAFCDCPELTSVTIPNSVTSIGNYAFWGCYGLTSVTILLALSASPICWKKCKYLHLFAGRNVTLQID